ncbi:MAG: succinate dehydrogenase, cytochrome b556 subunit [Pseudomonadota bacterium]
MADVNRGNRPLSPHLTIYKPQLHSAMSIFFRITGVGLTLGALLAVWLFLAAATSDAAFETAEWYVTSFIGDLIMLGSLAALIYHALGGIRHLWWDTGRGFTMQSVHRTGNIILGATAVLTLLIAIAS